jgi:hypothetical protein
LTIAAVKMLLLIKILTFKQLTLNKNINDLAKEREDILYK